MTFETDDRPEEGDAYHETYRDEDEILEHGDPSRFETLDGGGALTDGESVVPPSHLEGRQRHFADVWQAADKVVYSTTLDAVSTARTRLEGEFDPASVRELKASATSDLLVGGAHLAAQAFKAGLVDECQLLIRPILIGAGKPALPGGTRADLELLDDRQLSSGVVYLRYRVAT